MNGILKEAVIFNGLHLDAGAPVYIDYAQAQLFDRMDPEESLIVSVALKYFTVRAIVKKSQIKVAACKE